MLQMMVIFFFEDAIFFGEFSKLEMMAQQVRWFVCRKFFVKFRGAFSFVLLIFGVCNLQK